MSLHLSWQDGNYAFVLGIQCDIGSKGASAAKLKMIDDLFHLLPDTIMVVPQIDGNH